MDLHRHGTRKFPNAGLDASSNDRGWTGVAAELRSHPQGDLPAIVPTQLEVTLATRTSLGAIVSRKGAGVRQRTRVTAGTVWLCPVGVAEDDINISAPLQGILHIYLPVSRFCALADHYGDKSIRADAVNYLADVDDPLIRQLGWAIMGELLSETSAGRMLAESAALALTARIAQAHGHNRVAAGAEPETAPTPNERIARAISFVCDNLEQNLSIAELADVACLSPFHFARLFKRVTGKTPHAFVSGKRLERARALLARPGGSVADIALQCGFSNQAAFSTAFHRAVGCSPGAYRKLI